MCLSASAAFVYSRQCYGQVIVARLLLVVSIVGKVVTYVAYQVEVCVFLLRVLNVGAVVGNVGDAVEVGVGESISNTILKYARLGKVTKLGFVYLDAKLRFIDFA